MAHIPELTLGFSDDSHPPSVRDSLPPMLQISYKRALP